MSSEDDLLPEDNTAVRRAIKCCSECAQHYSADSMFCPFDGTPLDDMIWVAPTDPSVDPMLGSEVDGRYRVVRALGEGGTGTVYEVIHESLNRAFAMKVLRREVAQDEGLSARFIQEARATASLKHPHIVSITDFGRLPDKTPYFVMERLTGHTLAEVCKRGGQLPMSRAVTIVIQVAGALAAAHEAGIVHRDLKPENLFLVGRIDGVQEREGPGGRQIEQDDVRVVDFGAAKIAGASRITKTGIVFGTPHYMAPEQASGQPVDHRADIYALGVIMYELFSGHLPFEADTLMGVLTKHMFVEPPRFATTEGSDDESRLLGALEEVTLRAMTKKPEHRFQTMNALATELERAVAFGESGSIALAPDWKPQPRRRAVRPLSLELEGAERTDAYRSGDVPLPLHHAWRGPAVAGLGLLVLLGALGTFVLARKVPANDALAASKPSAPGAIDAAATSASSPAPPSSSGLTHLTTDPPFAEIWQGGQRVGTAPMDLPTAPPAGGSSDARITVRAPGYAERLVSLSASSPSALVVTLDKLPAVSPVSPASPIVTVPRVPPLSPTRPRPSQAAAKSHPSASDGELIDPFAR